VVQSPEERLASFYDLRAAEEPEDDPEATLRFRKVLDAAALVPGQRLLDVGAKWGGLGRIAR
jgi:cyclopropane fatty-acyl-phospholipid synthase-like methyltransferase